MTRCALMSGVVALVAVLLTGCTPLSMPLPPLLAPRTSAPAPELSLTPATEVDWTMPPTQLFDGDCNRLMPIADLGELLGTGVTSWDLTLPQGSADDPDDLMRLAQQGGLRCSWTGTGYLLIDAVPRAALPDLAPSRVCAEQGDGSCRFSMVVGQVILAGTITTKDPEATYAALRAVFTTRVATLERISRPWPVRDPFPNGCDTFSTSNAVTEVTGEQRTGSGGAQLELDALWPALRELGTLHCDIGGGRVSGRVDVLVDGSWYSPDYGPATAVVIAGADSAVRADYGAAAGVWAIHASDLIHVVTGDPDRAPALTAAVIEALYGSQDPYDGTSVDADAVLTTAGYGDLRIGQPVPANSTLVRWVTDLCGAGSDGWAPWSFTQKHVPFVLIHQPSSRTEPVDWIIVRDDRIRTRSGAHVGMTERALRALFPRMTRSDGNNGNIWSIEDANGRVVFEIAQNKVEAMEVMTLAHPIESITSTDAYGLCPA